MFVKLLSDVKSLNLPLGQYALFGSAPLLVRNLREASHDIDIVVKQDLWDEYFPKEEWETKYMRENDPYIEWRGHSIEFWKTWGPGDWDVEDIIDKAEIIDGVPYVQLETVLNWKKMCGRPKDLKDVELITAFLEQ